MSGFDDGYEALPHQDWAIVHDLARRAYGIREPWPVELAGHHLRWLQGERRIGRIKRAKDFPTTAVLAVEWNWPKWKVADFVAATSRWEDPHRPVDLVDLRGDRLLGANKIPTVDRRQADGGPTAETDERRESTSKADGKPTESRRKADVVRGNSARIHRATDQKTHTHPASGTPPADAGSVDVPAANQEPSHDQPAQPEPDLGRPPDSDQPYGGLFARPDDRAAPDLEPVGGSVAGGDRVGPDADSAGPTAASAPTTPGRRAHEAGQRAVWDFYRAYHPHAGLNPPKASVRLLRSAVAEHGAESVARVVRWAHESHDRRAKFLRDGEFLGLGNLLAASKLPDRIELASKWLGPPGPPAQEQLPADLPPAVVADLDRLPSFLRTGSANRPPVYSQQPDPDRCGRLSIAVKRAFNGSGWGPLYVDLPANLPRIARELVTLHAEGHR